MYLQASVIDRVIDRIRMGESSYDRVLIESPRRVLFWLGYWLKSPRRRGLLIEPQSFRLNSVGRGKLIFYRALMTWLLYLQLLFSHPTGPLGLLNQIVNICTHVCMYLSFTLLLVSDRSRSYLLCIEVYSN